MEFKLENPHKKETIRFDTFAAMLMYIKGIGEMNGWIITVHHM